jgi:hypothetical protein
MASDKYVGIFFRHTTKITCCACTLLIFSAELHCARFELWILQQTVNDFVDRRLATCDNNNIFVKMGDFPKDPLARALHVMSLHRAQLATPIRRLP